MIDVLIQTGLVMLAAAAVVAPIITTFLWAGVFCAGVERATDLVWMAAVLFGSTAATVFLFFLTVHAFAHWSEGGLT